MNQPSPTFTPPPVAPENVANVRAEAVHLAGDNYQFNISWDKPRFVPDYYVVKLYDLNLAHLDDLEAEASSDTRNVSGVGPAATEDLTIFIIFVLRLL